MPAIKVFIADDHQVIIDGISALLDSEEGIKVVGSASDGGEAVDVIRRLLPDVVLLDINMPDVDGIEACKRIVEEFPSVKVIALTMHNEYGRIERMLDNGAHGYLLKNSGADEIVLCINQVFKGRSYYSGEVTNTLLEGMRSKGSLAGRSTAIKLTSREKEVLALIVEGLTSTEIAHRLHIGTSTAETHRKNLLRKLDVNNSAGLVRVALEEKLVDRD